MSSYYLTGAAVGLSDLALRRAKIARFMDLNDPFELLAVDLRDPEQRRVFQKTRDRIDEERGRRRPARLPSPAGLLALALGTAATCHQRKH